MKKFGITAAAGISSLALAASFLIPVASAQSTTSTTTQANRPAPTQACIQAMASLEAARLANFDTRSAAQKQKLQTLSASLSAAAALTDETARKDAMTTIRNNMKAAREEKPSEPEAMVTAKSQIKTSCEGGSANGKGYGQFIGRKKGGHGGRGQGGRR